MADKAAAHKNSNQITKWLKTHEKCQSQLRTAFLFFYAIRLAICCARHFDAIDVYYSLLLRFNVCSLLSLSAHYICFSELVSAICFVVYRSLRCTGPYQITALSLWFLLSSPHELHCGESCWHVDCRFTTQSNACKFKDNLITPVST